ncbi:MAG: fused response regulator/phosphatase [Emcibacter sp.]|nr:fused response regulator/phosphatase [Emcibacter sp.]
MLELSIDENDVLSRHKNIGVNGIGNDILGSRILIVDDDELHSQLIAIILTQDGFKNLFFARNGAEALERSKSIIPDMIIMDILMPGINGLDVCRTLRKIDNFRNIPIIVHTIKHSPEERAEIYDAGATDIFPKPVSEREVHNRVYMYLKYSSVVKGLRSYHNRLARDLEIARSMQDALLPRPSLLQGISKSHKIEIDFNYETSNEMGGDFWGLDVLNDDQIFIYISDFSGHGVSASLNTFRLHSLILNYQKANMGSPAEYLEKLNHDLFKLLPVEQYATMLCGIIDVKKNIFTYAAAASTSPLKIAVGFDEVTSLDPSGFPLGMIKDATYITHEVPFKKGELLFLYSDVLTESYDQRGHMIGEDNFIKICRQASMSLHKDQNFLTRLLKFFDMLIRRPLKDDLTAVTFRRF